MNVLAGITVVEFAEGIAGPFCGQILHDLGARVIKVEPPDGDWSRELEVGGTTPVFLGCNRGKEAISVDLRAPEGPSIVRRLARSADVFLQAYRPGVAERAGLGADDLTAGDPRLVYCSLSGYGNRGPKRERPGSDTILQAYSGLMSGTGEPDRPPARVGTALGDTASGTFAALGIITLLLRRERTGRGGVVDTSILEALISLQTTTFSDFFAGLVPRRLGSRSSLSAVPAEAFATADGFVSVSCHAPRQWAKLVAALERPDLLHDARFARNSDRVEHHDALVESLSATLRTRTTAAWMEIFEAGGVNAGPINTVADVAADGHVAALGLLRALESERWAGLTLIDTPLTFDGVIDHPAPGDPPLHGEHNESVLAELGYAEAEIARFMESGVLVAVEHEKAT
jgi:crotonobetainyl-CoA:carnitine CoA-transferase CaiB-like acyl-CoA transferase